MTQSEIYGLEILKQIASPTLSQDSRDHLVANLKGIYKGHRYILQEAILDSLVESPTRGTFLALAYLEVSGCRTGAFTCPTAFGSREPVEGMLAVGQMLLASDKGNLDLCRHWARTAVRHFSNVEQSTLNEVLYPESGFSHRPLWEQALACLRDYQPRSIPVGATEAYARHLLSIQNRTPGEWEAGAIRENRPLILVVDPAAHTAHGSAGQGYVMQLRLQLRADGHNQLYVPPHHSLFEIFGSDFQLAVDQARIDNEPLWRLHCDRHDIAFWIEWSNMETSHVGAAEIDGTSPYGALTTAIRHLILNLPYREDVVVAVAMHPAVRPEQKYPFTYVDTGTLKAKLDAAAEHLSGKRRQLSVERVVLYDDDAMREAGSAYGHIPIRYIRSLDEISSWVMHPDNELTNWDFVLDDNIREAIKALDNGPWLTIYSPLGRNGKTLVAQRVWRYRGQRKSDRILIDCRKEQITTCNELTTVIARKLSSIDTTLFSGAADTGERLAKAVDRHFSLLIDSLDSLSDIFERQAARHFLQGFLTELDHRNTTEVRSQTVIVTLTDQYPLGLVGERCYEMAPPSNEKLTSLVRLQAPGFWEHHPLNRETEELLDQLFRRVGYDLGALVDIGTKLRHNDDLDAVIRDYRKASYKPGEQDYDKLTQEGKALFGVLSLLPQGADIAIARALNIDYELALESLRTHSNVLDASQDSSVRVSLRQQVIAFANQKLSREQLRKADVALGRYYKNLLKQSSNIGKKNTKATTGVIEADVVNIRALMLRAAKRGEPKDCRLVIILADRLADYYWWNHGLEGQEMLVLALKCAEKLVNTIEPIEPIVQQALCHYRIADLTRRFGHYSDARLHYTLAIGLYEQCVAEARRSADREKHRLNQARTYKGFADCLRRQADYVGSIVNYTKAEDILQTIKAQLEQTLLKSPNQRQSKQSLTNVNEQLAHVIKGCGAARRGQGNLTAALGEFSKALKLFEQEGILLGEANCKREIAEARILQGAYADAEQHLNVASDLYKRLSSQIGESHCLRGLGEVDAMCDRYSEAYEKYKRAEKLYKTNTDHLGWVRCIRMQAIMARLIARQSTPESPDQACQLEQAKQLFEQARDKYMDMWVPVGVAKCILGLADLARDRRDYMVACSLYHSAHSAFDRYGATIFAAICWRGLGEVYLLLGSEEMKAQREQSARTRFIDARDWFTDAAKSFADPQRDCKHWLSHSVIGIATANLGLNALTVTDVTNCRIAEQYYTDIKDQRGLGKFSAIKKLIQSKYRELWQQSVTEAPNPTEFQIVFPDQAPPDRIPTQPTGREASEPMDAQNATTAYAVVGKPMPIPSPIGED